MARHTTGPDRASPEGASLAREWRAPPCLRLLLSRLCLAAVYLAVVCLGASTTRAGPSPDEGDGSKQDGATAVTEAEPPAPEDGEADEAEPGAAPAPPQVRALDGNDADSLAAAQQRVRDLEQDLMALLDRVDASSVSLLGCEGQRRTDEFHITGAGSGVIVAYRGVHLITNAHVVRGCTRIKAVLSDGSRVPVTLRAFDRSSDLAILGFDSVPPGARPVPLDERPIDDLEEGSWVVATGNPFLLAVDGRSVATLGVFSGLRDATEGYNLATRCIQHDAEINPGNSGGPLWSSTGKLVGVNGAIVTRSNQSGGGPAYSGASFSVPAEQVRRFIDTILGPIGTPAPAIVRTGTDTRAPLIPSRIPSRIPSPTAALRLDLANSVSRSGERLGVFVRGLRDGTPLATLQAGDRITALGFGTRQFVVRSLSDLAYALKQSAGQGDVSVVVLRAGARVTWTGPLAP